MLYHSGPFLKFLIRFNVEHFKSVTKHNVYPNKISIDTFFGFEFVHTFHTWLRSLVLIKAVDFVADVWQDVFFHRY